MHECKSLRIGLLASSLLLALPMSAPAQQTNIENLKQMKLSGVDTSLPPVPQEGENAEAIRNNLKRIKLPPGFKIELYAVVPDARHMAWHRPPTCCSSAPARTRYGR